MSASPTPAFEVVMEALLRLPEMPFEERNPDGDEQARESMRVVAREGLIGLQAIAGLMAEQNESAAASIRTALEMIPE